MTQQASPLPPFHINRINDRSLGDLDSPLWHKIDAGYESVRDDLVRYYRSCIDDILAGKHEAPDAVYDAARAKFPNNCFSYAIGMIATGRHTLSPDYLNILDFSNPQEQEAQLAPNLYYRLIRDYDDEVDFLNRVTHPLMAPVASSHDTQLVQSHPVIGLYMADDFHFIRVNITHDGQKPSLSFSQKEGWCGEIISSQSLKSFQKNYSRSLSAEYMHPVLFAASALFVGRRFDMQQMSDNDSKKESGYRLTLKAAP